MTQPTWDDYARYLAAKKTVDDRALNAHVWQSFQRSLDAHQARDTTRILELGAGVGTMLERLLERGALRRADYLCLDAQPALLERGIANLRAWGQAHKLRVAQRPGGLELRNDAIHVDVGIRPDDVYAYLARPEARDWDFVLAHALLDVLDLDAALPAMLAALRPGGDFYLTINFDGLTAFQPAGEPELEAKILALYHRSMDERRIDGRASGDSRAGRRLFSHLRAQRAEILAAGASDWVVIPKNGAYPDDEAYFLHFILHTIGQQLRGHPHLTDGELDAWLERRHAQVERGELMLIAHQLDYHGRAPVRASG